jgi:amidohydrolase
MNDLYAEAQSLFSYSQELRRDFHRHPELGFKEFRTAGIVARELGQLGLEVHAGVAKTGVVALLEGNRPGPVVLIRFDMDALPIMEETGAEYASENPGVMHACGHDGHVATGLTVARLLMSRREQINGTVKFVFQPAEEGGGEGGAREMIKAGVLENPKPQHTLSLHLWNERPVGWLGITSGPLMAGAEIFKIILTGKGGHGALPHQTADPIAAAAQVITAIQTIVSRNVSPLKSAVITVGRLRAGEAFNVIPMTAEMSGTIRTFEPEVRAVVLKRLEQVVQGVAEAMGCTAEINVEQMTAAVINDESMAQIVKNAAIKVLPDASIESDCRTMGSEDMSYMMQRVPGCFFFVGSANPEKGLNYSHHHPKFDIDEAALPRAAALMTASVLDLLAK